jgi:putative transcriptional regulator
MMAKKERIVISADLADAEDFDVTSEGMERALKARAIRMARTGLGLSQDEFASRFRVPVGTLRDWEQARVTPPDFAVAYARVIAAMPEKVAEIVNAA